MVRVYYVGEIYNTNDPRRQQSKLEPKLGRYFRNVWEKILAAETVFLRPTYNYINSLIAATLVERLCSHLEIF